MVEYFPNIFCTQLLLFDDHTCFYGWALSDSLVFLAPADLVWVFCLFVGSFAHKGHTHISLSLVVWGGRAL